jgi:hypothetical protein
VSDDDLDLQNDRRQTVSPVRSIFVSQLAPRARRSYATNYLIKLTLNKVAAASG